MAAIWRSVLPTEASNDPDDCAGMARLGDRVTVLVSDAPRRLEQGQTQRHQDRKIPYKPTSKLVLTIRAGVATQIGGRG